jgi:hypothetical protein
VRNLTLALTTVLAVAAAFVTFVTPDVAPDWSGDLRVQAIRTECTPLGAPDGGCTITVRITASQTGGQQIRPDASTFASEDGQVALPVAVQAVDLPDAHSVDVPLHFTTVTADQVHAGRLILRPYDGAQQWPTVPPMPTMDGGQ